MQTVSHVQIKKKKENYTLGPFNFINQTTPRRKGKKTKDKQRLTEN